MYTTNSSFFSQITNSRNYYRARLATRLGLTVYRSQQKQSAACSGACCFLCELMTFSTLCRCTCDTISRAPASFPTPHIRRSAMTHNASKGLFQTPCSSRKTKRTLHAPARPACFAPAPARLRTAKTSALARRESASWCDTGNSGRRRCKVFR